MELKALEIYEYDILFQTDVHQYQVLFPRSLFPSNIKKGDLITLNNHAL